MTNRNTQKSGVAERASKFESKEPISPRRDVGKVVDLLTRASGPESALKRAISEQAHACRARSRQRFQFWLAIAAAIEARHNPSQR